MKPIEIVCHKGANEYAPENSYAAAQFCIDWGVDYVEIDVRTSQDGVFYLLHDRTVDRTTNGQGPLAELTAAEIDQLDAGSWFHPQYKDERIPRLDHFLRWIKGKAKLFLDVKATDPQALIDLIEEVGMAEACFFWSGSEPWMQAFRTLAPHLALKVNVESVEDVVRAHELFQANIVEVALAQMSQSLQSACQSRGIKLMIYHQQKDVAAFRSILDWKADMINLNHGDLFLEVLQGYGGKRLGDWVISTSSITQSPNHPITYLSTYLPIYLSTYLPFDNHRFGILQTIV